MNTTVENQPVMEAGDLTKFFIRLDFAENLDPGFCAPEEDMSWGRMQFWVNGQNLCKNIDQDQVRTSVDWYLLPVMEWFTLNWSYLFHEQRTPVANAGSSAWRSLQETNDPDQLQLKSGWDEEADTENFEWVERHALRRAALGAIFPDVIIRRLGHELEFSWGEAQKPDPTEGFRFFYSQGTARTDPQDTARAIYFVLKKATDWLNQCSPGNARITQLRADLDNLEEPGRVEERLSILAGLGRSTLSWRARWDRISADLAKHFKNDNALLKNWLSPNQGDLLCIGGSCDAALMFGSTSPTLEDSDVLQLATEIIKTSKTATLLDQSIDDVEHAIARSGLAAWTEGYRLAQDWSEKNGLGRNAPYIDIERHLANLGIQVSDLELTDRSITGIAVLPKIGNPRIFINPNNPRCRFPTGRRFVLAHELCHLLYDRKKGKNLALISGPWAPKDVEQRANAFAAELLMPSRLLSVLIRSWPDRGDFEQLLILAQQLHVSTDALTHHLWNLGLLDQPTLDEFKSHLGNK